MIVYLSRDISAFVMYCVYGTSRSSLLIESTDSMIYKRHLNAFFKQHFYILKKNTVVLEIFEVKLISYSTAITKINITIFLLLLIFSSAHAACKRKQQQKFCHKNNLVIEIFY